MLSVTPETRRAALAASLASELTVTSPISLRIKGADDERGRSRGIPLTGCDRGKLCRILATVKATNPALATALPILECLKTLPATALPNL